MLNRPHHYQNDYRAALRRKIEALSGQVFKRQDLSNDHSNREQLRLNRALNAFIEEGFIIKISHGLYAKAEVITLAKGKKKPVLRESFETIAMEALNKLGVQWELGSAIQEYNRGVTTQIPVAFTVQLKSRFRGTISAGNRKVLFEGGVNGR